MIITDKKTNIRLLCALLTLVVVFGANSLLTHHRFAEVEAKAEALATENEQLSTNLANVSAECVTLNENYENLQQSHENLQGDYATLENNYTSLTNDYDSLEEGYTALYNEYTEITETIFGYQAIEDPLTKAKGVNMFNGHRETYYNLPMGKVCSIATDKGIEGNYWVREDGAKMFGMYVIVAANWSLHPYGSIVETSLGKGIVLDTGTFIETYPEGYDLAVTW